MAEIPDFPPLVIGPPPPGGDSWSRRGGFIRLRKAVQAHLSVSGASGAGGGKGAEKLWEKARAALERAKVEPARIERSVGKRDVQELARVVGEMAAKK